MSYKYLVLIPAYEPDDKLIQTITGLCALQLPVLVVDDGSGAEYGGIFKKAQQAGAWVVSYADNCGKGYALKTGISWAVQHGYTGVVTADADGQHSLADIIAVKNEMVNNPNSLVLGVRNIKKMPFRSKFGNSLTAFLLSALCGIRLSDTQTGLRGICLENQKAEKLLALRGERYEYELRVLMEAGEIFDEIREIEIQTIYIDDNASSHFRPLQDGLRIYRVLFSGFPKFAAASILSFFIDYAAFNLLVYGGSVSSLIATIAARVVSATCNYNLNKHWVFQNAGEHYTLKRYVLLAGFILLANCTLIFALTEGLAIAPFIAKLMVEVLLYLVSFTVQSQLARRRK